MEKTFEIGTLVRLKSGGPVMTVDGIYTDNGSLSCAFFDDEGKFQTIKTFSGALVEVKGEQNNSKEDA